MGIGVPYYGDSSFDPVEFTRRMWDETRAAQAARAQQRQKGQEKITDFMEKVPSPEAWDKATAAKISQEAQQLTADMMGAYERGEFDPYARDEEGVPTWDRRMRELQGKIDIYKTLGDKYKAQWNALYRADPEKVDQELTEERFSRFIEEESIEGKGQMLQQPLLVMRPEPVEVIDELSKAFRVFLPDRDVEITSEDFDEHGFLRTETIRKIDPRKLNRAMGQVWDTLPDRVKNEFKRRYEQAPTREKTAVIDGEQVPIDVEDWFRAKYSPEYAQEIGVRHTRPPAEPFTINWGFLPGRREDGRFDLDDYRATVQMGQHDKMMRVGSAATIPLQEVFDRATVMKTTPGTVDNTDGSASMEGQAAATLPVSVNIIPVARETFEHTDREGNVHTFAAGDIIPQDVQTELSRAGLSNAFQYDAFLISKVDYQRVPVDEVVFGTPLGTQRLMTFGETQRTPLREMKGQMEAAARKQERDISPLFSTVDDILNELNNFGKIFERQAAVDYDQLFEP